MGPISTFTVEMDIYDVLYLSYLIPEERLRPAVPRNLPFALTSGGKTILSVVIFHSRNVKASFLPFLRFAYDQVNLRAYILDPLTGKPGVFFLKSGITSRLVALVTRLMDIPWLPVSMTIIAEYSGNTFRRYETEGDWEERFSVRLREDRGQHPGVPFDTVSEAARFLTGPHVGFYGQSKGLIRFEVRHSAIEPSSCGVSEIEFPLLVRLGFLTREDLERPLNVLLAPHARFTVFMPPTKIPLKGWKEE